MDVAPTVQREAEGAALAEAYRLAFLAYGDFVPPPSPCCVIFLDPSGVNARSLLCPAACDWWAWHRHLLGVAMQDAEDDLALHVATFGPVETEGGVYKLDGEGRLAFRRPCHDLFYRSEPCAN